MFNIVLFQTLTHSFRKGGGAFGSLAFYVIIATLFTFALGPEGMKIHAGAVMAVAMLLASVTSLPMLYERDHEDGTLEQFLLQPIMLELLALAKILGHWLAVIAPMLLISPLIALMSDIPANDMYCVLSQLLLASVTLAALASFVAALTLGNRRGGLLQALIMLPLATPLLIFAAAASGKGVMLFLAAAALASLPLACLVSAALIRTSQD